MNSDRNIDDAMLSAYLDGELSAQQLRDVRTALAADPALAERLEAMQRVNELVVRHAQALDASPLPSAVVDMLKADGAKPAQAATTATVVQGPWQRWSRHAGVQLALAASLVLALGLTLNNLREPVPADLPAFAEYRQQLDTSPSGASIAVDAATLSSRFSFVDRNGRYCRQYQLSTATAGSENIACRTGAEWALIASLPVPVQATPDMYQPASSSAELNALLDTMMSGEALDLETEAALIERNWQAE